MKNEKNEIEEKKKNNSEGKIRQARGKSGKKGKTSGSSPDGIEGGNSVNGQGSEDSDRKKNGRRKMGRAKKAGILFLFVFILAAGAAVYLKLQVFTPASGVKEISFKDKKEAAVTGVTVAYELSKGGGKVKITDLDSVDALINQTAGWLGHAVEIEAKGAEVESAFLTFHYDPLNLYGAEEEALAIGYYDETAGRMRLLSDCDVDTAAHTVTVHTSHFSQYALIDSNVWYDIWLQSQYIIRDPKKSSLGYDIQLQLDISGSMEGDKLELSKQSVCELIDGLSDEDTVSVSVFESSASELIPAAKLSDSTRETMKQAVMGIETRGGTNLTDPIEAALNRRKSMQDKDLQSLLILLTDGQDSVRSELLEEAYLEGLRIITVGLGADVSQETLWNIANLTGGQYIFAENPQSLAGIFGDIKNSFFGVEMNTDTDQDRDGLPDIVETTGMRNQFGTIIRTDPTLADTDEDTFTDGQEMGVIVIDEEVSEMDLARGLTRYVYFDMISDPTVYNGEAELVDPNLKVELSIRQAAGDSETVIVNADVMNDNHVKGYPSKYVRSAKVFLYQYASNVEVSVECPSCFPQECNQTRNIGGLLGGETVEGAVHFEAKHTGPEGRNGVKSYQSGVTIKEPTTLGNSECGNSHVIVVTVKADGCEPVVKKMTVNFGRSEIKINGNLVIQDHLTIPSDCTVVCSGDVKVKSKGILELGTGAVLETYGNFVFDSSQDHSPYLSQGEIKVHGNVDLKNGFYATGTNQLTMLKANGHTLNMSGDFLWISKNQQLASLYLEGGITGVRLKGDIDVSTRIVYSEQELKAELTQYDEDARLVVESYLSAIEKKGMTASAGDGFILTPVQMGKTSREAEDKIQYALVKWLASTRQGKKKVSDISSLISYMRELKKEIVDGVSIDPMFAMPGVPEGTTGKAVISVDGKTYSYYFSPDKNAIDQALAVFMEDINSYAYQEVKKQLNHAVSSLAPFGMGKYYNALAELMEAAGEGKLEKYFKEVGMDGAKKLAVKALNAEKYYEFYLNNKKVYTFVKNGKDRNKMPNEIVQEALDLYKLIR